MEKIKDIIGKGEYKKPIQKREFYCRMGATSFRDEFIAAALYYIHSTEDSYMVDEHNKDVINQLYYFLVGSELFTGDLIKGVLIVGSIGSGKTVLLDAFLDVFNNNSGKIVTRINSKDVVQVQSENPTGYLSRRPLFIDDIGKEQTTINTYGTVSRPMEDLINERYKTGGLTFGTSNLLLDDMPYNRHTIDRMRQMFNVITLPGKSRR